jgi:hypothetical protein
MRYARVLGFAAIVAMLGAMRTHDPVAAALAFLLFLAFLGIVALLARIVAKVSREPRRQLTRLR